LTVLWSLAGCGKSRREIHFATVSGSLLYQGKLLTHGKVVMIHGSGKAGSGGIQSNGQYQLQAPLGENMVMVECRDEPNFSQVETGVGRDLRLPPSLIPERYSNHMTSGLTVTVVDALNVKDWLLE
jgi:hypothetical protein